MPIYSLDNQTPVLPAENEVWIAPNAHIIGECEDRARRRHLVRGGAARRQ